MNHLIFYKNRQGVCPRCGGLLTTLPSDDIILSCIDCGLLLKLIGEGHADAELEFEEAELKNDKT